MEKEVRKGLLNFILNYQILQGQRLIVLVVILIEVL